MTRTSPQQSPEALQAAMTVLEAQRGVLGDSVVDAALAGLRAQLGALQAASAEAAELPAPTQALRLVSILFLDIVGSTTLAQHLDPEDVHALMDGALQRFTAIVRQHGGRVLQYAGDNLLAGFGAGEVHEDDADRAVRCGLALLAEGRAVGGEVLAAHGHGGFDVRVGIHSGNVLLGGGVEAEGTIRGNAVNVAARMEQSAPPGGLLMSVDTYRLVQGRFDVQEGQALRVKGIEAPILTYRVERERPREAHGVHRGVEGVTADLVGRAADLAQLHAARAAAQSGGAPQAITLIGEAGLGKTRLVAEFEASLPATGPGAEPLRAGAQPQGLHQPYGLIRDLLFRRFDVQDSDPLALAQGKLAGGLATLFGHRAEEQTALLGQLIGLDYAASPFIAGILQDGRQLRARAFHAWVEYVRLSCAQLPPGAVQVLMLDDLHWADDGSLDAVAHLAGAVAEVPLLLLCAARPELLERRPDWGASWPAHRRLTLQPLGAADQQALARSLLQPLGESPQATKLRHLLVERTDGNPFYMEALLQMLVDQGVLLTSTRPWQFAGEGLNERQVPTTLVGVLQARLDALLAPQRRALQQASVVGAVFWDEALATLDSRATSELVALCRRELVLPQEQSAFGDAGEFAFRHHLLHEVTYGTVLKRDKREQHHRAALWLEARSAGRGAEFAGLIAEHFERAGVPERAAVHWALAAQEASLRHADSAALAHADRALALDTGSDPKRLFALLRARAQVWSRRGDVAEYERAIAAMEALAEAQDDELMRLVSAQSRMHRQCQAGDYEQAHRLGKLRLASAEGLAPLEAARVHNTLVMALGRQGRHDEARAHAQAALTLAHAAGDGYIEASAHNNMSVGYLAERRMAEALASGERALALYESVGSRYGAAIALLNISFVAQIRGQVASARTQLEQLLQLCDAIGHQQIGAQGRCNLAGVLVECGELRASLEHAREGIRMGEKLGDRYIQTTGHAAAFEACYQLGMWPEALEYGRLAQAGHALAGEPAESLGCEAGVACTLLRAGDGAAALAGVEAVLAAVAGRGGWQESEAEAAIYCTRVLAAHQDPRAAETREAALRGLMAQAAAFADPAEREQFLQATASRRDIRAAAMPS
ncbi:MAG: AAA family ATPase [Burkholderiales bacterium]|nr:AAA family ATPase [Burkholderiales bacterium]